LAIHHGKTPQPAFSGDDLAAGDAYRKNPGTGGLGLSFFGRFPGGVVVCYHIVIGFATLKRGTPRDKRLLRSGVLPLVMVSVCFVLLNEATTSIIDQ
jgi:hypothetical protein